MKPIPGKTVRRLSPLLLLASLAAGPIPADAAGSGNAGVARDTASDTLRVRNLRAFAKLYGYVRWFHPSDEAAATDWDRFAVHGARRVMDAPSPAELRERLEELFLPIAPAVRVYPEGERPDLPDLVPDDTTGLEVVAWQHRGVGLREGSQYRSVRLNRPPPLREPQGLVYRQLPADGLRDRAVRFSAAARLAEPGDGGRLGLFLQVHGEGSRLFEADMEDRPVTDTGWARYRVEGKVEGEAEIVIIGAVLHGTGVGRVDEARLEVLEEGAWRTVDVPHGGFTAADSAGVPEGWTVQRSRRAGHRVAVVAEDGRPDVLAIALDEAPDAKPLFPERPAVGEATDAALGRGLRGRVPLALYGDAGATFPRAAPEAVTRLRRELDALDPEGFRPEDSAVRAAGVVVVWNVLQHFYPYFGVVEADWRVALEETLTRALAARDAAGYVRALNRMLHYLEDGHAHASHPSLGERRGLPIRTAWIAEQVAVVATGDTAVARPGDIVLSVDGEPAWQWLEREAGRLSGSKSWRRHRALVFDRGFGRGEAGTTARLELLRDGRVLEASVVRDVTDLPEETRPASLTEVGEGVFYVDLTRTPMREIEVRLEELASARGVIFDLRGHPADNRVRLLPAHLADDTLRSGHWEVPRAIYPDRRDLVGWDDRGRWELAPRTPRLRGRVVFLADARAVSFPEGILDMVAHHGLAELVGRATAGVTGNVNPFTVPGDVRVMWTGMKYLKPDSARHHGIGVRPTVPVRRTLEAVRQGRDEDLERAVELIGGGSVGHGSLLAELREVLAAYDEMAGRELWPDFDPGSVPLALFDGDITWLFRHPSPPEGFRPSPGPSSRVATPPPAPTPPRSWAAWRRRSRSWRAGSTSRRGRRPAS